MSATVQIIDEEGRRVGALAGPDGGAGFDQVVAVLGAQGSGKSTLCNAAFGLDFPTLDAARHGRKRTTVGVWAARARAPQEAAGRLIVLDVEGSDSRERGEGQHAFQSRVALLALAVADVLVLNLWSHDLGRHQAASYHLLEVILAQWARQPRPYARPLQFVLVLRDTDPDIDVTDIHRLLLSDLSALWSRLSLSTGAAGLSLDAARIHLHLVPLPHYRFSHPLWTTSVATLAATLTSRSAPHFRSLNADLFAPVTVLDHRIASAWDRLTAPSAATHFMDLPRHPALVEAQRARRAAHMALALAMRAVDRLQGEVEAAWSDPVAHFGTAADGVVREALQHFDGTVAGRRGEEGVEVDVARLHQREHLVRQVAERLCPLRDAHLVCCEDIVAREFDDAFALLMPGSRDFEKDARELKRRCVTRLQRYAEQALLPAEFVDVGAVAGRIDEVFVADFQARIDEEIENRVAMTAALPPVDGENLLLDEPFTRPPWWKPLLIQVANLTLNLSINWLLIKVLGGGHESAQRRQKRLERKQPSAPTF